MDCKDETPTLEFVRRFCVRVTGQVQGVGFRPFVWNRASGIGLTGFVRNDSSGVIFEIQGEVAQIETFLTNFSAELPPLARIDSMTTEEIAYREEHGFAILESEATADQATPIAPDVGMCSDCRRELLAPNDRRYGYPFINCTNCGPRFTIVEDVPYDRATTTMKSFVMCRECQREYDDPTNRRFHAQPNACPKCGPSVWFVAREQLAEAWERPNEKAAQGPAAIEACAAAIRGGQIVAVKGIGGFHLACSAQDNRASTTLRERKGRGDKPLAVMVRDADQAAELAIVDDEQRRLLESKERPIVLLEKRRDSPHKQLLDSASPGNDFIGVMLPYAPLHELLVAAASPLVMTSGNVSDEPIVRTNAEAKERLGLLAGGFLFHNRDIHVVCDDSVVRSVNGSVLPIRRSRGYAPMPVKLAQGGPSVLAVGGEIKATLCVAKGDYAYMSQHIGDVGNVETLDALRRCVDHFLTLYRVELDAVAADLHPDYLSSQWARQLARELGVPLMAVQHHVAHAAALLGEHRWNDGRSVIACCFDGTGYGLDGTIWGGEFLLTDGDAFDRVAQLDDFQLPGGDACVKFPYRAALAMLHKHQLPWDERLPCVAACRAEERRVLRQQLDKGLHCASSSSMGRLFDAAASLIGVRHKATYEAQAAMELEAIASAASIRVDPRAYRFEIDEGAVLKVRWRALLEAICRDVLAGTAPAVIAAQFHHATANMTLAVCQAIQRRAKASVVGLTGGVFQNVLLLKLVGDRLRAGGFEALTHSIVPPNDGGLALGQALVARRRLLASEGS